MNPNGREPYLSGGVCRMTKHQVADELMALRHNLEIAKHHQVAPLCPYAPLYTVHYAYALYTMQNIQIAEHH